MEITSEGVGIMVIVLGGMCLLAGVALVFVILKEKVWWERLIMGMLAMDMGELVPGNMGAMMPMFQQLMQSLLKKVFNYIRMCALVGGAGVSCLGAVLIVIGIYIWS